jgi:DhnA family fructose-bisphosphate aldolase class Ia
MDEGTRRMLADTRARRPHAIADAAARRRRRRSLVDGRGRLLLIAADHPARAAFAVGDRPTAMASRIDLLDRLLVALSRPGVDGVLGTPDVIEDLLLLGALDGKVVTCSMNRGGLPGSTFELDDRFTAYDAATIAAMGFDGGKMLLRIDPEEPGTAKTLAGCARAVNELADHRLMAMVEPFWARRSPDGRSHNDLDPDQMMRAIAVAQALGRTSAYTWLKVPVVADMARVMEATTLPTVLLGGDPTGDPAETYEAWAKALELPHVYGLTVGRTVLYPPDDDVAAAVDAAAALL